MDMEEVGRLLLRDFFFSSAGRPGNVCTGGNGWRNRPAVLCSFSLFRPVVKKEVKDYGSVT